MRLLLLTAVFLLLKGLYVFSQEKDLTPQFFRAFTKEHGLSGNQVTAVLQDSQGYLWVGTTEGLNRFDGRDFLHFYHDVNNPSASLSGNSVRAIYEYGSLVFVCTHRGISVFDLTRQIFCNEILTDERFNFKSEAQINFITKSGNHFYVGGESTLLQLNENFVVEIDLFESHLSLKNGFHRDFKLPVELSENRIFFPNCGKPLVFNPADKSMQSIHPDDSSTEFSILSNCQTFAFQRKGSRDLVVSSWALNPVIYSQYGSLKVIPLQETLGVTAISVTDIIEINNDLIIICTDHGLSSYDFKTEKCEILGSQIIRFPFNCILKDVNEVIWVGSGNGLIQYRIGSGGFKQVDLSAFSLTNNELNIHDMEVHGNQLLMNLNSASEDRILEWKSENLEEIATTGQKRGIRSISSLGSDSILIGFWDGMCIYSVKQKKFSAVQLLPDELNSKIVLGAIKDRFDNIWVALGANSGIFRYNIESKSGNLYSLLDSSVFHVPIASTYDWAMDESGDIYFVRSKLDGKLVRWSQKSEKFEVVIPENSTEIRFEGESYCIDADTENNIWFGVVREGLFCYNPVSNTIEHFDNNSGLLSNNIFALECDNQGNVWIGTSSGIEVFKKESGKFIHFTDTDGLPQGSFEPVSAYFNDTMFFNSSGRLIYFNPEKILDRKPDPRSYIYKIIVNGSQTDVSQTEFNYDENYFEFCFTSVDLIYGKDFQYRYRLVGLNEEWIYAGFLKAAIYANIPPGEYKFELSVLVDGIWKDDTVSFNFCVNKPFWLTWWFIAIMFSVLVLVVIFIINLRINRIKEIEQIRSKISRDLHDDIGSGLSSIRILSGNIKNAGNDKAIEFLNRINLSSQHMLDKMDDIIWAINPKEDKGTALLVRMREYAAEMTEAAGIGLTIEIDDVLEDIHLTMEHKSNLYLIFKEALNNACKYSNSELIKIRFIKSGSKGILTIADNGTGFDKNNVWQGNGIKNMRARAKEINAEIEIDSKISVGTVITIQFHLN